MLFVWCKCFSGDRIHCHAPSRRCFGYSPSIQVYEKFKSERKWKPVFSTKPVCRKTLIYARRHFIVDDLLQLCKVGHHQREGDTEWGDRHGGGLSLCVCMCARALPVNTINVTPSPTAASHALFAAGRRGPDVAALRRSPNDALSIQSQQAEPMTR